MPTEVTLNIASESTFGLWVTYLAVTLGMRYLIGEAVVTAPIRVAFLRSTWKTSRFLGMVLYALVRCPACLGFYVGLGFSHLLPVALGWGFRAFVSGMLSMVLGRFWSAWPGSSYSPLDGKLELEMFPHTDTAVFDETATEPPEENDDGIEETTSEVEDEGGHDG